MKPQAIILTGSLLGERNGKTAHGLVRDSERYDIVGVVDRKHAGKDVGAIVEGVSSPIPVRSSVSTLLRELDKKPAVAIVGVASAGGAIPEEIKPDILEAVENGVSVVSGLHEYLSHDENLLDAAERNQVQLQDLRKPRSTKELRFWNGDIFSVRAERIAVLGTDCALGKRTTTRLLWRACNSSGIKAELIYTGQTGWLQGAKYGLFLDSTINDFVCGELERAVVDTDREFSPEVIFLEGQSALRNPTGPCGAEFLCSAQAKAVILQHAPAREYYVGTEEYQYKIPPIASEIELIRSYGAETLAVTINSTGLSQEELLDTQKNLRSELGIPCVEVFKDGTDELVSVVKQYLQRTK